MGRFRLNKRISHINPSIRSNPVNPVPMLAWVIVDAAVAAGVGADVARLPFKITLIADVSSKAVTMVRLSKTGVVGEVAVAAPVITPTELLRIMNNRSVAVYAWKRRAPPVVDDVGLNAKK
jgi:hypothetical protein